MRFGVSKVPWSIGMFLRKRSAITPEPPFAKWFKGGQTNLCFNAVDRHLKDRADQNALICVSSETGLRRPTRSWSSRALFSKLRK
jgi:propionyl-CoA synthetase